MKVGLIGDYQEAVTAHQAIPKALQLAANEISMAVEYQWLHTSEIQLEHLKNYQALWCVPASPYNNTENVLKAINYARRESTRHRELCDGVLRQKAIVFYVIIGNKFIRASMQANPFSAISPINLPEFLSAHRSHACQCGSKK